MSKLFKFLTIQLLAKPIFVSVTFCLLSVTVITILFLPTFEINHKKQYHDAYKEASNLVNKISDIIHTRINMNQILASYIEQEPNISQEKFSKFVKSLLRNDNNVVKSMSYSTNFDVTLIAPYDDENKQHIGMDLIANPRRPKHLIQSIKTRNAYVEGPLKLTHIEGNVFLFLFPVFEENEATSETKLLGFVDLIIACEKFYEVAELDKTQLIDIALRSQDTDTEKGSIFYGDTAIFNKKDAIKLPITLPHGEWILAAYPKTSWFSEIPLTFLFSYFIAFVFSFGVYMIMKYSLHQIRQIEYRYRYVTERTRDILWTMDIKTMTYTFMNDICQEYTGFAPEEYNGMSFEDTLTPEYALLARQMIDDALATAESTGEQVVKTLLEAQQYIKKTKEGKDGKEIKNGDTIWIEISVTMSREANGKFEEIIGVSRVINNRKKLELDLKETEEKFRIITENSRDVVWMSDLRTEQYLFASGACFEITGFTPDEILNMHIRDMHTPEDYRFIKQSTIDDLKKAANADSSYIPQNRFELQQYHKDGSLFWVEIRAKILVKSNLVIASISKIDDRKQIEFALVESEKKYRMLAENMTDIIWLMDLKTHKFTFVSGAIKDVLGFTPEERLQQRISDIYPPDTRELAYKLIYDNIRYYLESGITLPTKYEAQQYCKDGSLLWVETSAKILPNEQGVLEQIIGTTRDINDRKQTEFALVESEKKYRMLAENMTDIIWSMDLNTYKYTFISGAIRETLGFLPNERLQQSIKDIYPPEALNFAYGLIETKKIEYQKTGIIPSAKYEIQQYHKDGSLIWVETSAKMLPNEQGELYQMIGSTREIDERKRIEFALKESEMKFQAITENTNDLIWILDIKTMRYTYESAAAEKLHGFTLEEVRDNKRNFFTSLPPETVQFVTNLIQEKTAQFKRGEISKLNTVFETPLMRKDGSSVWVEISASGIPDAEGNLLEIYGVTRIIEDRKAAELQILSQNEELEQQKIALEQQKEVLEQLNATKDKFFSIIAHDLKNPFSSLINMSGMLAQDYEDMDADEIKQSIGVINNSSKHIYRLLENLLEWSKSSRGEITYNPLKCNINEIIYDCINNLQSQLNVKNITVKAPDAFTSRCYVLCDDNMIHTVVRNLISNAIKFSYNDSIVEIDVAEYSEDSNYIQISIKDSGVGINANDVDKLFRIDSKISTLGTLKEKGTGLGLIICKEFIDKHNCKIWATSEKGKGTTFYFILPQAQP